MTRSYAVNFYASLNKQLSKNHTSEKIYNFSRSMYFFQTLISGVLGRCLYDRMREMAALVVEASQYPILPAYPVMPGFHLQLNNNATVYLS